MTRAIGDSGDSVRDLITSLLPSLLPGARVEGDDVVIPIDDWYARSSVQSVFAACSRAPAEDRPQVAKVWLQNLTKHLRTVGRRRDAITEHLRVRLVSHDDRNGDDRLVSRRFGPALRFELVADVPGQRRDITQALAKHLGLDEVWALNLGLQNTIEHVLAGLEIRQHALAPSVSLSVASATAVPFVSVGLSAVPLVFRERFMPYGALVAAPRLSTVMCQPVESTAVFGAATILSRLVADMHREATDPCTPRLWWHHAQHLYPLKVTDEHEVQLHPALEPVVESLPRHALE